MSKTAQGFDIDGGALLEALAYVTPHASKDMTLPHLACVQLEVLDNQLVLIASDSFSIGTYRIDPTKDSKVHDDGFATNLHLSDLTNIAAMLKNGARHWKTPELPVSLRTDGTTCVVSVMNNWWTYRAAVNDVRFPSWRTVMTPWPALNGLESPELHSISKEQLQKLLKGPIPKYEPIAIGSPGGNKPMLVMVGDRYVAMLMPIRRDKNPTDALPSWMQRENADAVPTSEDLKDKKPATTRPVSIVPDEKAA